MCRYDETSTYLKSASSPGKHDGTRELGRSILRTLRTGEREITATMSTMPPFTGIRSLFAGRTSLIFDFDGTIAETGPPARSRIRGDFGATRRGCPLLDHRWPENTQEAILRCFGTEGRSEADFDLVALVAEKQQRVRKLIAERLEPIAAVDAFLVWARSRFRMALVTSGSRGRAPPLRKLGYEGWFDPIVCAEDVTRAKPAPDGLLKAGRRHCRCVPSKRWCSRTQHLDLRQRTQQA